MKEHVFDKHNGTSNIVCSNCGLSWIEILRQLNEEDAGYLHLVREDDCEIRKRKQKLKAFW